MSDDLLLIDDDLGSSAISELDGWAVMIVDDEPAVHEVTKLVMAGFQFDGRPISFISCYSAEEARLVLQSRDDIALMLLDVVMESDTAGLDLARYVREELKNLNVRIVLRTGQPGQAPEEHVIKSYDINDYKEKTERDCKKICVTGILTNLLKGQQNAIIRRTHRPTAGGLLQP